MIFNLWPLNPYQRSLISRVWGWLVTLTAIAVFLYQTSFNIKVFMDQPTVFMVTMEPNPNFRFPPVTVCPKLVFEPTKVKNFGLDISGSHVQIEENLYTLKGISENQSVTKLWMETFWELGQVIKYVDMNLTTTIYSDSDKKSPIWRNSLSPLGRCLTLFPPVGVTRIGITANLYPYVEQCHWVDEKGEKISYPRGDCKKAVEKCNSSCDLENYIYSLNRKIDNLYIYFHGTNVPTEEDANEEDLMKLSALLFDGHYVLQKVYRAPSITSKAMLVDSSLVKGSCIPDDSYDYGECYRQVLTEIMMEKHSCRPVSFPLKSDSVQDFCYSPEMMTKVYLEESKSLESCPRKCKQTKWFHTFSESYDGEFEIVLLPASTEIRKEVEIEAYPISQLASDTGGSLGLFLGVSILSFWEAGIQMLHIGMTRYPMINRQMLKRTNDLLLYSGIMFLSIATAAHCLVSTKEFIFQNSLTAVSLSTAYKLNDLIDMYIAQRLSSRAFDCQSEEPDAIKCQVNCMLDDAVRELSGIAAFVNVDDLPSCENKVFEVPSYDYIVPPAMLTVATHAKRRKMCEQICYDVHEGQNSSRSYPAHMNVNIRYYSIDSLRFLCGLGGIVGLYLGYSITDLINVFRNTFTKKIVQVLNACIFVFGILLVLWQVFNFLLHHQMTSSSTTSQADHNDLVLTVCRWPPYDFTRISDLLGLDITERQILRLPKEERLPQVMKILNLSMGNLTVSIDELWEQSAWSVGDVIDGFMNKIQNGSQSGHFCEWSSGCSENWKPIVTLMNRCYSMNISDENSSLTQVVLLFPNIQEKKDIFGTNSQVYFSVHSFGEYPLLSNMIYRLPLQKATGSLHTVRYQRLDNVLQNTDTNYGTCIYKCLGDGIIDAFGCRLPYVLDREDAEPCNQNQYVKIPAYFKGLEDVGAKFPDLESREDGSDSVINIIKPCYEKCHHLHRKFNSIQLDREIDYYPTITLMISEEHRMTVVEEDRHTTSQLFSDIGSVASSTIGFSLHFFFKNILIGLI